MLQVRECLAVTGLNKCPEKSSCSLNTVSLAVCVVPTNTEIFIRLSGANRCNQEKSRNVNLKLRKKLINSQPVRISITVLTWMNVYFNETTTMAWKRGSLFSIYVTADCIAICKINEVCLALAALQTLFPAHVLQLENSYDVCECI